MKRGVIRKECGDEDKSEEAEKKKKKIGLYPIMKLDEKPPEPSRELLILIHAIIDRIERRERRLREEQDIGHPPSPLNKGCLPPRPDDSGIWVIRKGKIKKGKRQQIT